MEQPPLPPAETVPLPPPAPAKPPFAKTAALFCAWSPLIAIVFNLCMGFGAFIMFAGVVLGIVALCGIPKHGKKGILIPAVFGLTINIVLVILGIVAGKMVVEKARALQEETARRQLQQQQAR